MGRGVNGWGWRSGRVLGGGRSWGCGCWGVLVVGREGMGLDPRIGADQGNAEPAGGAGWAFGKHGGIAYRLAGATLALPDGLSGVAAP
jgi:hypothetical protein